MRSAKDAEDYALFPEVAGGNCIEHIKRTTAEAEKRMIDLQYSCWVPAARARKWKFAAKTAQTSDNRWSKGLLEWSPFFRCSPHRSIGHPLARWDDWLVKIAGRNWPAISSSDFWPLLEHGFIHGFSGRGSA